MAKPKTPTPEQAAGKGETFHKEQEQGFRGRKVDPTPDSAYTRAGVGGESADPTPETDPAAAKVARDRLVHPDLADSGEGEAA